MRGAVNYFKAAERVLSERGNLEKALENMEARKEGLLRHRAPRDILPGDLTRPYTGKKEANSALADLLDLEEITDEIAATVDTIGAVDRVLGQLDAQAAALLRAWYIEKRPKEEIAATLGYAARGSIYNLRNEAVSRFAVLYFGAGALPSI